jgi:D-alanyl-D-alanine carboxypeptidase/D-alanyl-D-alanine-endopeptidase (penicillin-binding protein 4)
MSDMHKLLAGGLALVLSGAALAGTATASDARTVTAPRAAGDLKTDIDAILADSRLDGASIGVSVRDAGTGKVLYDNGASGQETPGSNNKLETSTAAFGILGAKYRFTTKVSSRNGNLYIKGTGDPTMRAAEYDALAAAVAAKGITKVTGNLVADDTYFDSERTNPDWDPSDLPYSYAAGISALTVAPDDVYDIGSIGVNITPGTEGQPVNVAVSPPTSVIKIDNEAVTGPAGSASTLSVDRTNGTNIVKVTGSYPSDAAESDHLTTAPDPTMYAADVFRNALKAHGVQVAGATVEGTMPSTAATVTETQSPPLSQIATPWLKLSNNPITETVTKAIGHKVSGRGTWAAGLAAISAYLKNNFGVDTSQIKQTDGSGLAATNKTTPEQITNVLKAAQQQSWFSTWYNALPIAGEPDPLVGGTLASRMQNTAAAGNLHGKTGTLTGVTALSGYVTDPTGEKLIFSIMFNGYQGGAPKDIEDKIAVRLAAGHTDAVNTVRRAPSGQRLECSWTKSC